MDLLCYYLDSIMFSEILSSWKYFYLHFAWSHCQIKADCAFHQHAEVFWCNALRYFLPIFLIHAPKLRVAKEQNIRIICRLGKNRNESMWMNGPINNLSLVHWLILMLWPNLNRSLRNRFWEQREGDTFPDWNSILATLIATLCTDLLDGCLWV